jgi:hypothetical protein
MSAGKGLVDFPLKIIFARIRRLYTKNNSCVGNNYLIVQKYIGATIGYVIMNGLFIGITILPLLAAILFSLRNSLL